MAYKQKSPIAIKEGGTNAISVADNNGIMAFDGTRYLSISPGTAGQILTSNGPLTRPTFQDSVADGIVTLAGTSGTATGSTVTVNGSNSNITTSASGSTLSIALANSPSVSGSVTAGTGIIATTGGLTATAGGLTVTAGTVTITPFNTTGALVCNASGVVTDANANTAGYVLTSNGSGSVPTFQPASGGGGGLTFNNQTSSTVTMAVNNSYLINNGASLVTATLPTTAALGDQFQIIGSSSGGWTIAQNSGQSIHFGNTTTTTGATGTLSSTNQYDQVTLMCSVANTTFVVTSSVGNLTVV